MPIGFDHMTKQDLRKIMDDVVPFYTEELILDFNTRLKEVLEEVRYRLLDVFRYIEVYVADNSEGVPLHVGYEVKIENEDKFLDMFAAYYKKHRWDPCLRAYKEQVLEKFFYHKNGNPRHALESLNQLYAHDLEEEYEGVIHPKNDKDYNKAVNNIMEDAETLALSGRCPAYAEVWGAIENVEETPITEGRAEINAIIEGINSEILSAVEKMNRGD